MTHSVGSIVRARDREWIVLPESSDDAYNLQPLGGNQEESTTILTAIEAVEPASFPKPQARHLGDHRGGRILRDAARLQNRNTTGPFRSFGRLGIDLRPYQLVPLLLALRRETTRLLIADDVGIGKTVESLMIARELLDRGDIQRFVVLCPPHLAEQWTQEIRDKFHLDAVTYLPETADRLRRPLAADESVFTHYKVVVASIDFVKMESRRDHFLQNCPEFVIVDEAHTASNDRDGHMRHHIVEQVCKDPKRHVVFVTATPHTGSEDNFRNLLGMLDNDLRRLPDNLQGDHNEKWRRRLADFMVQRRRENIRDYADEMTPFPTRLEHEESYALAPEYRALVEEIIEAQRSRYQAASTDKVRSLTWWSLLSILRAFASSPLAAAQTLHARSGIEEAKDIDAAGRRAIIEDPQEPKENDAIVGANTGDPQFLDWSERAMTLASKDKKLKALERHVKDLLEEGRHPIVFCQFIPTARHVAEHLAKKVDAAVNYVTGDHAPADRRERIIGLQDSERRVLVATDCLSEGINLQEGFDAVIHYDLAWTPTRHEQREGRVDRYGQKAETVKMLTLYGVDNIVDGVVLEVLHRKQASITGSTGVHVPVPDRAGDVLEAIMQSLLVRGKPLPKGRKLTFQSMLDVGEGVQSHIVDFDAEWRESATRAKSRSMYAWESIKPAVVMQELSATREALGDEDTVKRFVLETLKSLDAGIHVSEDTYRVTTSHWSPELRRSIGIDEEIKVCFGEPRPGAVHLNRTHPVVESLCDYVIETAIDDLEWGPASRCGVTRTKTTGPINVYLARFRYQLRQGEGEERSTNLVEEIRVIGLREGELVFESDLKGIFDAEPSKHLNTEEKEKALEYALKDWDGVVAKLASVAQARCEAILETHRRVQVGGKMTRKYTRLEPEGEPDLLGCYVFLPEVRV